VPLSSSFLWSNYYPLLLPSLQLCHLRFCLGLSFLVRSRTSNVTLRGAYSAPLPAARMAQGAWQGSCTLQLVLRALPARGKAYVRRTSEKAGKRSLLPPREPNLYRESQESAALLSAAAKGRCPSLRRDGENSTPPLPATTQITSPYFGGLLLRCRTSSMYPCRLTSSEAVHTSRWARMDRSFRPFP
jgi:hypothetical protein